MVLKNTLPGDGLDSINKLLPTELLFLEANILYSMFTLTKTT